MLFEVATKKHHQIQKQCKRQTKLLPWTSFVRFFPFSAYGSVHCTQNACGFSSICHSPINSAMRMFTIFSISRSFKTMQRFIYKSLSMSFVCMFFFLDSINSMRRGIIYIWFTHCLFQLKNVVRLVATVCSRDCLARMKIGEKWIVGVYMDTVCAFFFRLKILNHEYCWDTHTACCVAPTNTKIQLRDKY